MSIAQTVLVFVGIPLAVAALIAVLVYSGGRQRSRRYRPGRPYDFAPVWFVAAPERLATGGADGAAEVTTPTVAVHSGGRQEIATTGAKPSRWPGEGPQGDTGGASDRW